MTEQKPLVLLIGELHPENSLNAPPGAPLTNIPRIDLDHIDAVKKKTIQTIQKFAQRIHQKPTNMVFFLEFEKHKLVKKAEEKIKAKDFQEFVEVMSELREEKGAAAQAFLETKYEKYWPMGKEIFSGSIFDTNAESRFGHMLIDFEAQRIEAADDFLLATEARTIKRIYKEALGLTMWDKKPPELEERFNEINRVRDVKIWENIKEVFEKSGKSDSPIETAVIILGDAHAKYAYPKLKEIANVEYRRMRFWPFNIVTLWHVRG